MDVELSDEAERDIVIGTAFYANNGEHVGEHFQRCMIQDAYSLGILGGIHESALRLSLHAGQSLPLCHLLPGQKQTSPGRCNTKLPDVP